MRTTVIATALCICVLNLAAADPALAAIRKTADIPAEGLGAALEAMAKDYDFQVLYRTEVVGRLRSPGAVGSLTPEEALNAVLSGTGLTYRYLDEKTVTIIPTPRGASAAETSLPGGAAEDGGAAKESEGRNGSSGSFRVAQVDHGSATGASSVAAATAGPSDTPQAPATLEEVFVTAQKRTERQQDVPTSIEVLSGSQLQDRGAVQLSDYAKVVPGLNVIGASGPGVGEVVLRGISTGSDHSSPVGLYLDDVPFTPSSPLVVATGLSFDPDLADIDHIEVLEGPQSTLYGANTVGGLVKFVTKQPDLNNVDGSVGIDGSKVDNAGGGYGVRGSVNVPIVDGTVALRASAFYRDDPGFVENDYNGRRNINWDSVKGGRLSLRVKFTDNLETTVTGMAQNIDQTAPNNIYLDPSSMRPSLGNLAYSSPIDQPRTSTYRSIADTTTLNLPFVKITNVASYAEFSNVATTDYSALGVDIGLPPGDLLRYVNDSHSERYTDELRLASAPGRVEWLLGGFYTHENDYNTEVLTGTDATTTPLPASSIYQNAYNAYFGPLFKEKAVFADITVHVLDQVEITGGARYSSNDQSIRWYSTGLLGVNNLPSYGASDSATTYLATVSYKPTADLTAYLRAASAYRPGGPNVLNAFEIAGGLPSSFRSDLLWNYEAGVKGSLWDRRISYTADGFHMVWTNIQLTETINDFTVVANGSRAQSDGAEASLQIEPIEHLNVGLRGAYTDARFTGPAPALGAVSGDPLPYAPKTSFAALGDYRFAGFGAVTPTAGMTYAYHGANESAFLNGSTYRIPSYDTLDLRAGFEWRNFTVSVRVDNLTNKYGLTGVDAGTGLGSPLIGTIIKPRTVGISLRAAL